MCRWLRNAHARDEVIEKSQTELTKPLRVCFVCGEYPPGPHGGIGSVTQVLARALADAGHDVRVVGLYPAGYSAAPEEDDRGVRVRRLFAGGRAGLVAGRYRLYRTVEGWCRRGEIDVVEVPDTDGWAAGWPRLPVPVVTRCHGSTVYFRSELGERVGARVRAWEQLSLRRADLWCAVSRYTAERTRALFHLDRPFAAVLYNPVEVPPCPSFDVRSGTQVVFSGRSAPRKGLRQLLRAWRAVKEARPEAELHVFGGCVAADGDTARRPASAKGMAAETRVASEEGAPVGVFFHGRVARERVAGALRAARVAVFPSYVEAFAVAPMEAMANACPTVYTRRSSGPELIEHGRDGWLVDPDQPEEIAQAIIRLLVDEELARRLGNAGRERIVRQFSVEKLLGPNEELYRTCVADFHEKRALRRAVAGR